MKLEERKSWIVKQSDFNRFASLIGEDPIELAEGEIAKVEYDMTRLQTADEQAVESVSLSSGQTLRASQTIYSRALPEQDYYVISDAGFEQLPMAVDEKYYHAWQAIEGEQHALDAAMKLSESLPHAEIKSVDYNLYMSDKYYAPTLFVGLFIGLVFFVSAGSFLYFRLYMDLDGDKQKFQVIGKLGLSDKELKKVLTRQIAILFFSPIAVALIHGAVALTALSHMFYRNLWTESAAVLGVFLLIQVVYFMIVRHSYIGQIKAELQH